MDTYQPATEVLKVGQRVNYEDCEEGVIVGVIDSIEHDEDGDPAVAVIRCDNGTWATLDLRQCAAREIEPTRH